MLTRNKPRSQWIKLSQPRSLSLKLALLRKTITSLRARKVTKDLNEY
jgi:hypothetical protein